MATRNQLSGAEYDGYVKALCDGCGKPVVDLYLYVRSPATPLDEGDDVRSWVGLYLATPRSNVSAVRPFRSPEFVIGDMAAQLARRGQTNFASSRLRPGGRRSARREDRSRDGDSRFHFRCSGKRCGRAWTFKRETLEVAYRKALADKRSTITLGVDT
jgi:hypothetical protein